MKKGNIKSFQPVDSVLTDFDRNLSGERQPENKPECNFWSRPDEQLCVQLFRPDKPVFFQPHTHSTYTIIVCLAGSVSFQQLNETCMIYPGAAVMSNAGVEHATTCLNHLSERCETLSLTFSHQLLATLAEDFQLSNVKQDTNILFTGNLNNHTLYDCATGIVHELRRRAAGHKTVVEALAMRLLAETLRAWPHSQIKRMVADLSPRLSQRDFIRTYEFMRRCRKEDFRLQHLCSFLGISEERFTRLFLASTNHTPANFYNRMLLERGQDLLRDSTLSIKEISFELGFKTTSHFIATFRREFDTTPQEYRQRSLIEPLKSAAKAIPTGYLQFTAQASPLSSEFTRAGTPRFSQISKMLMSAGETPEIRAA